MACTGSGAPGSCARERAGETAEGERGGEKEEKRRLKRGERVKEREEREGGRGETVKEEGGRKRKRKE